MTAKNLEEYLKENHCGKENAIKSYKLEKMFNCSGQEIRQTVNHLRKHATPICSGREGYYYAATDEEVIETIYQLKHRIICVQNAIDGLEWSLGGY